MARGNNFADGLAVSPLAYRNKTLVILTCPTALPALAANWVVYLPSAYGSTKPDIQIYGGDNVVSDNVMNKLRDLLLWVRYR